MDKERAKIGLIIGALILGGCSVAVVIGSGSARVDSQHDIESDVESTAEEEEQNLIDFDR